VVVLKFAQIVAPVVQIVVLVVPFVVLELLVVELESKEKVHSTMRMFELTKLEEYHSYILGM
jgi:hypothetical protein